jgi:hypothetical protein
MKIAKVAWELTSALMLVLAVGTVMVAEEIAPRQTDRFVRRFESQLDRVVDFLLHE